MKNAGPLHVFAGRSARVELLKGTNGGAMRVVVRPQTVDGTSQLSLGFLTWVCDSPDEAWELARLLQGAAALAAWVEAGGKVEEWLAEAPTRPPVSRN